MRIITISDVSNAYYLITPEGIMMNYLIETIFDNTGMRKGSFADQQIKKIFSSLFQGAVDLKHIYNKYYSKEYDSFREFLYQYKTFEYDFIDYVSLSDGDTIWELRQKSLDGIEELIGYNNEKLPLFNQFLEEIRI